jgi:hypothetical protein
MAAPAPVDRIFRELPGLLRAGDLLVFNDTRVVKARIFGEKASGGKLELLIERVLPTGHEVVAHMKVSKKPQSGSTVHMAGGRQGGGFDATLLGRWPDEDGPLFRFALHGPAGESPWELMERHGHLPLPPYIERQQNTGHDPDAAEDSQRYQTVFARAPGAVAAPTAALHFDDAVLADLAARGIERASVTLHVGAGTFQPVKTENLAEHQMHSEWYEVPWPPWPRWSAAASAAGAWWPWAPPRRAHARILGAQRPGHGRHQYLHHAGLSLSGGGCAADQLPPAQKHADDAGERLCGVRAGDGVVPPRHCAGVPLFQLWGCDAAVLLGQAHVPTRCAVACGVGCPALVRNNARLLALLRTGAACCAAQVFRPQRKGLAGSEAVACGAGAASGAAACGAAAGGAVSVAAKAGTATACFFCTGTVRTLVAGCGPASCASGVADAAADANGGDVAIHTMAGARPAGAWKAAPGIACKGLRAAPHHHDSANACSSKDKPTAAPHRRVLASGLTVPHRPRHRAPTPAGRPAGTAGIRKWRPGFQSAPP